MAGGTERVMAPNFFKIVEASEILMLHRKIFALLTLVKIKLLNFIGKSLSLAPHSTGATTSLLCCKRY